LELRVRVPASTSNLGPGFDCFGLALDLHLTVDARVGGGGLEIETAGSCAAGIATDAGNLVYAALERVLRRAGKPIPPLVLRVHNEIPLERGLGSSGAAVLAGVLAGHLLAFDEAPDPRAVLRDAAETEGHPDNVAPSLLGGFVACGLDSEGVLAVRLPTPADLLFLLVIPERGVSTSAARQVLPGSIPFRDAAYNLSRVALLVGALCGGRTEFLRAAMQDRMHEPYRLDAVPGLRAALAALRAEPAVLGAALSGSGPTLIACVAGDDRAPAVAALECLQRAGVAATSRVARPSSSGATWERLLRAVN
jgi:homoserine kinase